MNVRRTGGRNELDIYSNVLRGLMYRLLSSCQVLPAIANGSTAGNLQTVAAVTPLVDGVPNASLVATDDLWDLSAETDTAAAKFRAYWLYVSAANAASFVAGSDMGTAADALRTLPLLNPALSIIGVYVAGVATDFDDAGGLAAQGTIHDRVPDGASKVEIDTDIVLVAT
jgi:hypothetical protein